MLVGDDSEDEDNGSEDEDDDREDEDDESVENEVPWFIIHYQNIQTFKGARKCIM